MPGTETGYLSITTDAVWSALSSGLVRIDPTTLEFEQIEQAPRFGMAASQDAVWATDFDGGTVSRFDPATNEGTQVAELSGNPAAVAVFGDSVSGYRDGNSYRIMYSGYAENLFGTEGRFEGICMASVMATCCSRRGCGGETRASTCSPSTRAASNASHRCRRSA